MGVARTAALDLEAEALAELVEDEEGELMQ
jgi:hypothetical protein